jgi:hypothetical protein
MVERMSTCPGPAHLFWKEIRTSPWHLHSQYHRSSSLLLRGGGLWPGKGSVRVWLCAHIPSISSKFWGSCYWTEIEPACEKGSLEASLESRTLWEFGVGYSLRDCSHLSMTPLADLYMSKQPSSHDEPLYCHDYVDVVPLVDHTLILWQVFKLIHYSSFLEQSTDHMV